MPSSTAGTTIAITLPGTDGRAEDDPAAAATAPGDAPATLPAR